ncbi:ATP-dependent RNA helicase HrpA [Planctomicrobium piriforme]|uniref:ATP-dependent helicase HrpA n=1 Tax=Planctomicrobium piriforme TaxID=1576369 RepID=A0A1I3LWA1_9PLAN|nr:ATP-dependent RNA helicase HrpA [Planctomicrobium piriforme]SFI89048.1 ATP-dependent helicase HrpA [Planctomicrobium piriforme]
MTESTQPSLEELEDRIARTMLSDRHRLRRGLSAVRHLQQQQKPFDRSLSKLLNDIEPSAQRYQRRAEGLPKLEYDPLLPIFEKKEEIIAALAEHQVIVVCGETGSGKSTQLPKICLEAGRGIGGLIGHTQPRRIAARSVAARVAEELNSRIGDAVAFKIRFTDTTSPRTLIKLMTDGVLLAESQSDTFLNQYDTVIIDEAHERSLNIDFLLGYLKRILPQRPELRVIITSATIDAERFAAFFGSEARPAPVIEVSGRTYPVEIRYRPPQAEEDEEVDYQRAVAEACEDLMIEGPGDILVFMPTERDIRETTRVLQGRHLTEGNRVEIVPLFGRLSEQEQNRVFAPHSGRRIVIATNVAESSLTVPGIIYVIDPGTARISRFSSTSQVQRLPVEPVSQASANQRAGRCGRIAPGICVRLYSAEDFAGRDAYTPPEILRTNLASVLLQMKALHLGRIEDFPFLDPPSPTAVRSGLKTLFELNAIDDQENLTAHGKSMARLPVDPRIGRMILAAADEHCLEELLIIAAALEQRDARERPLDKQQAADAAHVKFKHERSDFMSLLKLWDFYTDLDDKLSNSKLRKACQQNFLSYNRMREWKDLHRQLREIVIDHGIKPTDRRNDEQAIHRAILTGTLSNLAQRGETHEYTGAGGQKLFLWPGSVAFEGKPKWVIGAELVETTRRFIRMVGPIQPQWVEKAAEHLVKRTYSEPHWSSKQGSVIALEKVTLFGLVVVPRRECRYGHIDPKISRELFIQHALVEGDFQTSGEFFKHNSELKSELEDWQAKLRQGLQFLGEEAEFDFYDQRIPADVFDGPRFEQWRKTAEAEQPRLLFLSREDLVTETDSAPRAAAFPDQIRIGTMQLPVEYHLEPGTEDDGVTLLVPPEGLNQLSEENLNWLVPGLLEEKVAALIKTLPKTLRTLFVPVPETAAQVTRKLAYGKGDLLAQLSEVLRQHSGEYVPVTEFDLARLPDHLRFNVRVVDPKGKTIAAGRDIAALKQQAQAQSSQTIQQITDQKWHRDNITSWNFGDLPEQIQLNRGGVTVVAFPMLVDQGTSITLRLADSRFESESRTKQALNRLFLLSDEKKLAEQIKHFPKIDPLCMQALPLPDGKQFRQQLTLALAAAALFRNTAIPRSENEWNARLKQARGLVPVVVQDLGGIVGPLLTEASQVRRLINGQHPPALAPLIDDLRQQYAQLFAPGYLSETPLGWLQYYPRYLQTMQHRFAKATSGGFQKDRKHQEQLDPYWKRYLQQRERLGADWRLSPQRVLYRFLLEEFRVSLFAQQLRTAVPVSEKRLNEVWREIA